MTISTDDQLTNALANNSSRLVLDKASIANAVAGSYYSLWRATGQPGQGAIPAAAAACNETTLGGFSVAQQTAPATGYLGWISAVCSNAATGLEIHDRLAHMGGLSGIVTTAQTVGIDLSTLSASNNIAARMGDAGYGDVTWWLEWYTDTGATAVTATVAVTYNDGTTGNLTGVSLAATRRASLMIPLNGSIPAASSGKAIRAVTSVTLSATTGTAGSFGVTATRQRASFAIPVANLPAERDFWQLGGPEIFNQSCLFPVQIASTTTTGTVRGQAKVAHG